MLKIVPDPPNPSNQSLEEILIQISEYLACGLSVAEHSALLNPKTAVQLMTLATMHEMQSAHRLVEVALSKLQSLH
jgi:hypothetical protein